MRWVPMQFCPAAQNAPDTHDSTVASRSQSLSTSTGALPPRSMASFFKPAPCAICSPVAKPPVKETMRTSRTATSALPSSAPPVATVTTASGNPASTRYCTSFRAERGASSEGFRMTALPPASAGPSLCATRLSGSLYGVMARINPNGSRVNQP
ncbi:hypothetical protein D3C75_948970 [compost metagenome]